MCSTRNGYRETHNLVLVTIIKSTTSRFESILSALLGIVVDGEVAGKLLFPLHFLFSVSVFLLHSPRAPQRLVFSQITYSYRIFMMFLRPMPKTGLSASYPSRERSRFVVEWADYLLFN